MSGARHAVLQHKVVQLLVNRGVAILQTHNVGSQVVGSLELGSGAACGPCKLA